MAKPPQTPVPTSPTISLAEGKRRLEFMRDEAEKMLSAARWVPDEALETWTNTTLGYIKNTFGSDTPHKYTFIGQQQVRFEGYGGSTRAPTPLKTPVKFKGVLLFLKANS